MIKEKPYRLRHHNIDFTVDNPIIGQKPVNRKKDKRERRQRPSPTIRLNRGAFVFPKTSESKYNSDETN